MAEPDPIPAPGPENTPLTHEGQPLRLIAIDIDGTITDMKRRLEWDAVVALRAAEAAGIPVVMATGNVIPVSKTFGHSIGTTGPHVCENGGVIYWETPDTENGGIQIHRKLLHDRKDPDRVVAQLQQQGRDPRRISSDPWRESETALELAAVSKPEVEATIQELGLDHLYVVTTGFACHILHKGVNKYEGLRLALDWLNDRDPRFAQEHPQAQRDAVPLALEEVLAIGDSQNDLEMIEHAGAGVALAHSPPELKQLADLVSQQAHGAGVRETLVSLGLQVPPGPGQSTTQ